MYPAGEYEAILITLGDGDGANWWCVLFPPLCFLDFSNGVAVSEGFSDEEQQEEELVVEEENVEEEMTEKEEDPVYAGEQDEEEVEVKFFLAEIWDKLFG